MDSAVLELGWAQTQNQIQSNTILAEIDLLREDGVAENYKGLTASFCLPVASILALHPSTTEWANLLRWTKEVTKAKFAIADGALKLKYHLTHGAPFVKEIWDCVDNNKRLLLAELPGLYSDIAIWKMKSLTVGDKNVMEELWQMAIHLSAFQWKFCKKGFCKHNEADLIGTVTTLANAPGVNTLSPSWLLPDADASGDAGLSQPQTWVYAELTQSSLSDDNPASEPLGKRKHTQLVLWPHENTVLPAQGDEQLEKKNKKKKKRKKKDDASF
jgi:hypothetical protein